MSVDPYRLVSQAIDFHDRFFTDITVDASPAAAAETIIANVTINQALRADQGVLLIGWAAFTVGTDGVSALLNIRRTDVAGAVKAASGALTGEIAATKLVEKSVQGFDALGAVGNQKYVLTLTVGSGSAESAVSGVLLAAIVV
jgi:hypothetical protein